MPFWGVVFALTYIVHFQHSSSGNLDYPFVEVQFLQVCVCVITISKYNMILR